LFEFVLHPQHDRKFSPFSDVWNPLFLKISHLSARSRTLRNRAKLWRWNRGSDPRLGSLQDISQIPSIFRTTRGRSPGKIRIAEDFGESSFTSRSVSNSVDSGHRKIS
jgi:hypothetical protein